MILGFDGEVARSSLDHYTPANLDKKRAGPRACPDGLVAVKAESLFSLARGRRAHGLDPARRDVFFGFALRRQIPTKSPGGLI